MNAQAPPLSKAELRNIDAYWRAANYLSVGQIYLYDNPLLKKPLTLAHIKPRLLGHWGTTPGLNFVYVHLNRAIKAHDLSVIYIAGPGHGGPGMVANAYLEQTYSEVYPHISQDEEGMKRLFTQFSFPGGIPSHVAPETPGSIHEGGELGYSLSHAFGAAFDNPDLLVACVVGDGEAETAPLATSWHSNKFLNPVHDGAVLPILHLNEYKIAGPTVLARIPREELEALIRGYGYVPHVVEGDDPMDMHQRMGASARYRRQGDTSASSATPARTGSPCVRADPMIVAPLAEGVDRPEGGGREQDPGFIDHVVNKKADVIRVYLPPDANTLLSVTDNCLRSRSYINVIRRRQAAVAPVAGHGRGRQALHRRPRHLALGQQRSGRRAGCRHGVLRRCAHA
jgi:phosphoketolase